MMTLTRVLCPVDLSDCSRHALVDAVAIAKRYGASMAVLLVVPPATPLLPAADLGPYPLFVFTPEDLARLREELEKFVKDFAGDVPFAAEIVEGNVVPEIVHRAADLPADLIVMGTHGRSGFEHLMLGSVTERVLVKAICPVLTVPPRASGMLDADRLFTRVLCGVDFSPASMKALDVAARLAADAGARLNVAHVLEQFPIDEPVMMGSGTLDHDRVAAGVARSRLREAIPGAVRALEGFTELVAEGKAYREILRLAVEEQADLIVIGAHGSTGGLHVFGSTTNQIVRRATCPVLTMKA